MFTYWFKTQEKLKKKLLASGFESNSSKLGTIFVVLGFVAIFVGLVNQSMVKYISDVYIKYQSRQTYLTKSDILISSTDPIRVEKTFYGGEYTPDNIPTVIIIPSAKVDLKIKQADIIDGKWEVFDDTASFGLGSYPVGIPGNTVIFAHAKEKLFLPLKDVKVGDLIYLFTENNWFRYQADEIKTVMPNDISIIGKTDDERITLYTCSGYADLKRLVIVAKRLY